MPVGPPRRDDAALSTAHCIDDIQLKIRGSADGGDPLLPLVSAFVGLLQDQALEYAHGVPEIDAMLGEVGRIFGRIPIERHLEYVRIVLQSEVLASNNREHRSEAWRRPSSP
jgi:hypothetical protein